MKSSLAKWLDTNGKCLTERFPGQHVGSRQDCLCTKWKNLTAQSLPTLEVGQKFFRRWILNCEQVTSVKRTPGGFRWNISIQGCRDRMSALQTSRNYMKPLIQGDESFLMKRQLSVSLPSFSIAVVPQVRRMPDPPDFRKFVSPVFSGASSEPPPHTLPSVKTCSGPINFLKHLSNGATSLSQDITALTTYEFWTHLAWTTSHSHLSCPLPCTSHNPQWPSLWLDNRIWHILES